LYMDVIIISSAVLPPVVVDCCLLLHETFTRPWLEFISKSLLLMPQSLRAAGPWSTAELSSSFKFPFFLSFVGFEFPFVKKN
jgi:hypothetical protein